MSRSRTQSFATPREVVERYNYELWNDQNYATGAEIIGDHIVRNPPGARVVLTRQQAIDRVREFWAQVKHVKFDLRNRVADEELCAIVYDTTIIKHDDSHDQVASIEILRVVAGRIVEVGNPVTYDHSSCASPEPAATDEADSQN